ncbi:ATP-dependent RNA helicase-like protein [Angomonas deanei]|uniref:Helicase conserved C-terminal domain containing protein, putative n=1 Tax=Angomonas deanei TaxID=59799 RepID=A0A7G2CD88_9TRYP|nr:ATP-dependent RNA helicase-like protein [Angomonas deanei]CAD2216814.1 Helicase conserved C-terminal domain containing protein, putative [Angomonas deanei]|eukprot:EPY30733.1 ATP-dependent RNA helicase-like protein [Angomonas deanei]
MSNPNQPSGKAQHQDPIVIDNATGNVNWAQMLQGGAPAPSAPVQIPQGHTMSLKEQLQFLQQQQQQQQQQQLQQQQQQQPQQVPPAYTQPPPADRRFQPYPRSQQRINDDRPHNDHHQRHHDQHPQNEGRGRGRGRGGNRGRGQFQDQHNTRPRFHQDQQQQQQPPQHRTPLTVAQPVEPPPPKREPDAEAVELFKKRYAAQEEEENVEEHLKAQNRTSVGTTGTIDVEACFEMIEKNDVVFVVTDTGTGKSTLIPKKILDCVPGAMIVSSQPRRTATINLAQRVATLLGQDVGEKVGYSVRGEHCGELGDTPLMYATNYTLFLHLLWRSPEAINFTHIFLDEIHERTAEVELMILILKLTLQKYPKKFKVILCSATAVVEQWSSIFDESISVAEYTHAKIMYPVFTYHAEDIADLTGCYFAKPEVRPDAVVTSLQIQNVTLMIKETLRFLAKVAAPQHSILIFLPGRTLVEHMTKWIKENLGEQLDPVTWYRDVDLSFIQSALQRESFTKKKVYVATDIAEVSLTLPDVVFVIDSGTCKRPMITEKNSYSVAFPPLQLLWESPNNFQQRRGRIGRVQQGFYMSMLGREHNESLTTTDNPVANSVLHELVLHSLQLTASPLAMFTLCREKPREISVQHSLLTLRDGGFIFPKDDEIADKETVVLTDSEAAKASSKWNEILSKAIAEHNANKEKKTAALAEGKDGAPPAYDTGKYHQDLIDKEYQITVKGLITSIAPTGIEAGSTIFYSLLFGMPVLGVYMAAVEACRSPFYVPYDIYDKAEKLKCSERVSEIMKSYHGEYNSDIISCVFAVLDYLDMQRDGLSEEAQMQWCEERFLSRTRVIDILNLVKQMKEQIAAIVPFPNVDDVDIIKAQMDKSVGLANLLNIAAHIQWSVYVERDGQYAQRKGYLGSGVFIKMNCLKDHLVPTVCPWRFHNICVPLSLCTLYNKLLCTFAAQVSPGIFNVLVVVFSHRVVFSSENDQFLFSVSYMGTTHTFECDKMTAQQILQLRRILCARMCVLQLQVERRIQPEDREAIAKHLEAANCDFGIPEEFKKSPHLIPTLLQSGLGTLVQRIQAGINARTEKLKSLPKTVSPSTLPKPEAYCWVAQRTAPLPDNALQSVLVHSGNGIAAVQESTKSAMFQYSKQTAARPQEGGAIAPIHESDEDSSSEEDHAPHFRFD